MSRDPERIGAILSALAKDMNRESGVLTDRDIDRQFLETYDMKITRALSRFRKGQKLSEADLAPLADSIKTARGIIASYSQRKLKGLESSYQGNPYYAKGLEQNRQGILGETEKVIGSLAQSKYKTQSQTAPAKKNPFR
jgi:hypothetical protein